MDANAVTEIVGYAASALIVLSITQTSILKLRLFGFAGGLTFLIYALAIGAYPIAVVNVIGASIHAWYLRKLIRRKAEVFRILHVAPDSEYVRRFLEFYADDIQGRFQPEFVHEPEADTITAFTLRDMVPAGLFIGEQSGDGRVEVKLDFAIPQYRDFAIGSYLYSEDAGLLADVPATSLWSTASNPDQAKYLRRMGFAEVPDVPGRYERQVDAAQAA
ncbi:MAG: hypothetical protein HKN26_04485 [Acidimicrobiales bacterium]|nr:hypothetical protein [Acidimicrobiales bacterium]